MQKFILSLIGALFCGYLTFLGTIEQGSESNLENTEEKTMLNVVDSHAEPQEVIVYAVKKPLRGWNDVINPYVYLTLSAESSKDYSSHLTVQKESNEFQRLNILNAFKEEKAYYDFYNPYIGKTIAHTVLALAATSARNIPPLPDSDLCPHARARSPGTSIRYLSVKYISDV